MTALMVAMVAMSQLLRMELSGEREQLACQLLHHLPPHLFLPTLLSLPRELPKEVPLQFSMMADRTTMHLRWAIRASTVQQELLILDATKFPPCHFQYFRM